MTPLPTHAGPIEPNLYQHLTHLLVNTSKAAIMPGRERDAFDPSTWPTIAKEFLLRGVTNVVITLAAKGAFYANQDRSGHDPASDAKTHTTNARHILNYDRPSYYLTINIVTRLRELTPRSIFDKRLWGSGISGMRNSCKQGS